MQCLKLIQGGQILNGLLFKLLDQIVITNYCKLAKHQLCLQCHQVYQAYQRNLMLAVILNYLLINNDLRQLNDTNVQIVQLLIKTYQHHQVLLSYHNQKSLQKININSKFQQIYLSTRSNKNQYCNVQNNNNKQQTFYTTTV